MTNNITWIISGFSLMITGDDRKKFLPFYSCPLPTGRGTTWTVQVYAVRMYKTRFDVHKWIQPSPVKPREAWTIKGYINGHEIGKWIDIEGDNRGENVSNLNPNTPKRERKKRKRKTLLTSLFIFFNDSFLSWSPLLLHIFILLSLW